MCNISAFSVAVMTWGCACCCCCFCGLTHDGILAAAQPTTKSFLLVPLSFFYSPLTLIIIIIKFLWLIPTELSESTHNDIGQGIIYSVRGICFFLLEFFLHDFSRLRFFYFRFDAVFGLQLAFNIALEGKELHLRGCEFKSRR